MSARWPLVHSPSVSSTYTTASDSSSQLFYMDDLVRANARRKDEDPSVAVQDYHGSDDRLCLDGEGNIIRDPQRAARMFRNRWVEHDLNTAVKHEDAGVLVGEVDDEKEPTVAFVGTRMGVEGERVGEDA